MRFVTGYPGQCSSQDARGFAECEVQHGPDGAGTAKALGLRNPRRILVVRQTSVWHWPPSASRSVWNSEQIPCSLAARPREQHRPGGVCHTDRAIPNNCGLPRCATRLEFIAQGELHVARRSGVGKLAESRRCCERQAGRNEIHVVESVESLGAKLQAMSFPW